MSEVRITEVDVRVLEGEPRPWMLVLLHTNVGITGIGEIPMTHHSWRLVQGSGAGKPWGHSVYDVERLGTMLLDEDPFRTEFLFGSGGKLGAAPDNLMLTSIIGGFDIACWDIKGKHLGVPVHELLGGKIRESIEVYANGWGLPARSLPEQYGDSDQEEALAHVIEVLSEAAEEVADAGYTACKFSPFQWGGRGLNSGSEIGYGIEAIEAVHDILSPTVDLLIEGHRKFSVPEAMRVCRALEQYDVGFFEEPVPPELSPLKRVAAAASIPISTGELLFTHHSFADILSETDVSVLQPDVAWSGGITELIKVASMASAERVGFAPHNAGGPILTHAAVHVDAVAPAFTVQESFEEFYHPAWADDLVVDPLEVERGLIRVPDRPGLGAEIDESVLQEHEIEM